MAETTTAMRPAQRLVLTIIAVAQFIIALDYSIVYVALPSMGADLQMSEVSLQWIITAYSLPFAGFLLLGGRIVDRLGALRMYGIGIVAFGAASAVAGLATTDWVLILARAAQGVTAAFLQPAILALLSANFPSGAIRAKAYSIWGAVGASGLAAGVVFGGVLTTFSWRWIFLINIPLTLLCMMGARKAVDAPRGEAARRPVPLTSTALGTIAVLLLVLTLTLVGEAGQAGAVVTLTAAATVVALTAFLVNERRSTTPLVDRSLRTISSLRRGSLAAAFYMSSVGTEFFLVTLFLQDQRGYSPLAAGIAFLPLAALVTFGNMYAGRLLATRTPAQVLLVGFGISAVGLGLLGFMLPVESYWIGLLPGFLLSGFGHGIVYTSMFVLGTSGAPSELEGAASSLITSAQYVSGAIGVAVLTLILGQVAGSAGYSLAFGFNAAVAVAGVVLALATRSRHSAAAIEPARGEVPVR